MKQPNRLKELREARKLTQREVGYLMGMYLGEPLDHTTVSKHESGDRPLDQETVKAYARLYKVETYELFLDLTPPADETGR